MDKCDLCLWNQGSGGGGGGGSSAPDMVILTTDYTGTWRNATYSVIAGSYSALRSKLVARNQAIVWLSVEQSQDGGGVAHSEYVPTIMSLNIAPEGDYGIMMYFTDDSGELFQLYALPDGTVSGSLTS